MGCVFLCGNVQITVYDASAMFWKKTIVGLQNMLDALRLSVRVAEVLLSGVASQSIELLRTALKPHGP